MDGTIKQSRRFAELERLSDDYFRYHLASVMDETRDYLARKQGEEMKEYSTSLGGVLSMMASSAQPLNDPYQLLKVTGEWNSKTTEDYVEMCKEKIAASEDIQHDLAYMAGQWRDAVVKEIGRKAVLLGKGKNSFRQRRRRTAAPPRFFQTDAKLSAMAHTPGLAV